MTKKDEVLAILEAAGLSLKDLASVVSETNRADTDVRVNDEENRKFGDVSIYKVQDNGFARPKMGVFTDSIPGLIGQLEAAYAVIQPEAAFTPFALATETDSK